MSQITSNIQDVVARLQNNDVVAIPTETVYGLAADASSASAMQKIFSIKQRPLNHPLIMHVAPEWDLTQWVENIPDYAKKLIAHYWPGPLTLVLPTADTYVHPLVTGGQNTVAIRAPNHPIALELLRQFGKPIVAPSANLFGKISPTTSQHVQSSFINENILILEGGRCDVGIESTILLATEPHEYKILRHGIIDENSLNKQINTARDNTTTNIRVSGNLKQHYQPEKPLYYVEYGNIINCDIEHTYVIHFSQTTNYKYSYNFILEPNQAAHELYYQLRQADTSGVQKIIIEMPPSDTIWLGLRDRILKASSGKF